MFYISSYQINISSKALRTTITPYQEKYATSSATKPLYSRKCKAFYFIAKDQCRANLVPRSILSINNLVSSVNSLNASYGAKTKLLSFKTINLWFRNLWNLSKSKSASNLLLLEQFLLKQFLIQYILHSLVLHLCNILYLNLFSISSNFGDIYYSNLGKFSSSVTTKCFPTFLSLLVSFLTCYSSFLFSVFSIFK